MNMQTESGIQSVMWKSDKVGVQVEGNWLRLPPLSKISLQVWRDTERARPFKNRNRRNGRGGEKRKEKGREQKNKVEKVKT